METTYAYLRGSRELKTVSYIGLMILMFLVIYFEFLAFESRSPDSKEKPSKVERHEQAFERNLPGARKELQ